MLTRKTLREIVVGDTIHHNVARVSELDKEMFFKVVSVEREGRDIRLVAKNKNGVAEHTLPDRCVFIVKK
jgi:hypothetical protein